MSTYVSDYPTAPYDAVMPAATQQTVLWIASVALAGFVVVGCVKSMRERTALPLLYLVAGFCTILMEPLVDLLGHAIHPVIGQISLFKTADRPIPWHAAIIYSFYFGGVYMFLMPKLMKPNVSSGFIWKCYFIVCVLAYLLEVLPVQAGLWIYYDKQALWFWHGGMPLWWVFVNAACIFWPMALMKILKPALTGFGQLLVIPLSVMGANMAHFGAGVTYYNAANSTASDGLVDLAGLASVGLALLIVHLCVRIFTGRINPIE